MAMRLKGESVSELAAFTAVAREYVPPLPIPSDLRQVDIPTYAGKRDSWHVLLPAAIVASAAGVSVLLHGYDGVPNRLSTAAGAAKLGIPIDLEPKQATEFLVQNGLAYLDVGLYHPLIFRFLDILNELGVLSFFQLI